MQFFKNAGKFAKLAHYQSECWTEQRCRDGQQQGSMRNLLQCLPGWDSMLDGTKTLVCGVQWCMTWKYSRQRSVNEREQRERPDEEGDTDVMMWWCDWYWPTAPRPMTGSRPGMPTDLCQLELHLFYQFFFSPFQGHHTLPKECILEKLTIVHPSNFINQSQSKPITCIVFEMSQWLLSRPYHLKPDQSQSQWSGKQSN